jgi:hypothetical protein
MVDERLATAITSDANDFIYQREASHDYDPSAGMEKIEATLLLINAADNARNPPGNRRHRRRDQTRQEQPDLSDPCVDRDARSCHHRQRQVLYPATERSLAEHAAAEHVGRRAVSHRIN